jgi:hypothetical protein
VTAEEDVHETRHAAQVGEHDVAQDRIEGGTDWAETEKAKD